MDWLKRRVKSATPTAWRVIIGFAAFLGVAFGLLSMLLPPQPDRAPGYVAGPTVILFLCVLIAKSRSESWNLNHCALLGAMVGVMWAMLLIAFAVSRLI